jgi:hypothetical protein
MPMAIALAFGILFATTMTLVLIPCVYITMDGALRTENLQISFLFARRIAQEI